MELARELIIVPDIHGRTFWKDAIPHIQDGTPVVFLGDYLDPYSHERITPEAALRNFKEILEATKDKSNVHLLIGNHDCTYIWPEANICRCRTDYKHFGEIQNLFRENLDRFHLHYYCGIGVAEPVYLFTHAGVHPDWIRELVKISPYRECTCGICHVLDTLDRNVHENDQTALKFLDEVSYARGGWAKAGSCVWADIQEFREPIIPDNKYLQVVGHTQQLKQEKTDKGFKWVPNKPVKINNVICLDCHDCFYVDSEGDIRFLKDDKIIN